MQKAPREILPPPLPSPDVTHPPHAEMKHTEGADALVPEFAARWRAKREHLNKLHSTDSRKKRKDGEGDLLVYVPMRHPNTHPRKNIQNTLKIHRI